MVAHMFWGGPSRRAVLVWEDGELSGDDEGLLALYPGDEGRQFPVLPTGPFLRLHKADPASVWAWLAPSTAPSR